MFEDILNWLEDEKEQLSEEEMAELAEQLVREDEEIGNCESSNCNGCNCSN